MMGTQLDRNCGRPQDGSPSTDATVIWWRSLVGAPGTAQANPCCWLTPTVSSLHSCQALTSKMDVCLWRVDDKATVPATAFCHAPVGDLPNQTKPTSCHNANICISIGDQLKLRTTRIARVCCVISEAGFNDHVLLLNFIVVLPHVPILSVACLHDLLHMCFHTFGVMQWRHFLPSSASSLLGAWQIFGWAHGPTVGNLTHNIFDCMTEYPHTSTS